MSVGPIRNEGSGDSGRQFFTVDIPRPVLDLITEADKAFEDTLAKDFYLRAKLPRIAINASLDERPIELARKLFHVFANFSDLQDDFSLAGKDGVKIVDSMSDSIFADDQRKLVLLLYLILKAKSEIDNEVNESLSVPLANAVRELEVIMPEDSDVRGFLVEKFNEIKKKLSSGSLIEEIDDFLLAIETEESFDELVDYSIACYSDISASTLGAAEQYNPAPVFEAKQKYEIHKHFQEAYDEFQDFTEGYISDNKESCGPNGSFSEVLAADFNNIESAKHLSIDFSLIDFNDITLHKRRAQETIGLLDTLADQGIFSWAFDTSLSEYGFFEFAQSLKAQTPLREDLKIQELVEGFIQQDSDDSIEDYLSYLFNKDLDFSEEKEMIFIDFIEKLRAKVKEHEAELKIFSFKMKDTNYKEWMDKDSKRKALFNTCSNIGEEGEVYPMRIILHRFTAGNKRLDQSELEDIIFKDKKGDHYFHAEEALAHALYYISQADRKGFEQIKDGDCFTLSQIEEYNASLDEMFWKMGVDPIEINYGEVVEAELLKIVYVGSGGNQNIKEKEPELAGST